MSDVFEGYERQYCELSANLSTIVDGGISLCLHFIFLGLANRIHAFGFFFLLLVIQAYIMY